MNYINQITIQGKKIMKEEFNNLNCINDLICKHNYEKPNLQFCKCSLNSIKTVKKNKFSSSRIYYY